MKLSLCRPIARFVALGLVVLAYFLLVPEDVAVVSALFAPLVELVRAVAELARPVLELSGVISPWLYMVIAVGILAWTVVEVWGPRKGLPPDSGTRP
jgi:hypothetical protein